MEGRERTRLAEGYSFYDLEFEEATKVKDAIDMRIAVQKGIMRVPETST